MNNIEVKELFSYADGELIRLRSTTGARKGDIAGTVNAAGYKITDVNNKKQLIHRLVFLYHYGHIPKYVDHIDGNPLNNRIENLRGCSLSENQYNSKTPKNNISGVKGVHWCNTKRKWVAKISVNNKNKYIGSFHDLTLASYACDAARKKYHGEFYNKGSDDG